MAGDRKRTDRNVLDFILFPFLASNQRRNQKPNSKLKKHIPQLAIIFARKPKISCARNGKKKALLRDRAVAAEHFKILIPKIPRSFYHQGSERGKQATLCPDHSLHFQNSWLGRWNVSTSLGFFEMRRGSPEFSFVSVRVVESQIHKGKAATVNVTFSSLQLFSASFSRIRDEFFPLYFPAGMCSMMMNRC